MDNFTCDQIYREFCDWDPEYAAKVINYRRWGSTSIVIWLNDGRMYKVKRIDENRFVMQRVTDEDIRRKYGPRD